MPVKEVLLLADNDANYLETTTKILTEAGYTVQSASNPITAREILKNSGIDLAILDFRLEDDDPNDRSGLEIAMDMAFRKIPKIILTGFEPSYEYIREAMGISPDELPPAASFVGKEEGPARLCQVIRETLEKWPSLRVSSIKVSEQIKADHDLARKQARQQYIAAVIASLLGFVLIFTGIVLAWFQQLEIGIVVTTGGVIIQVLVYLFFQRLDRANVRMDIYHRELVQTYWLELLVATCDQLPSEKQINTTDYVIRQATQSWFALSGMANRGITGQENGMDSERG